jgi:hypothetical protein
MAQRIKEKFPRMSSGEMCGERLARVSKPGFDLFQRKRDLIFIHYNPDHCNFVAVFAREHTCVSFEANQKCCLKMGIGIAVMEGCCPSAHECHCG